MILAIVGLGLVLGVLYIVRQVVIEILKSW
jgi:hypothetical protein